MIFIFVYSCSSHSRHRSRSGEAVEVVSFILFTLSSFLFLISGLKVGSLEIRKVCQHSDLFTF